MPGEKVNESPTAPLCPIGNICLKETCPGPQHEDGYVSEVVDFGGHVSGIVGEVEWCGQGEVPPMVELRRYHQKTYGI